MMRTAFAHLLSLVGHPAILTPSAAALAAVSGGASPQMTRTVLFAAGAVALAVMVYTFVQVRQGNWADADASLPEERSQLNLFLLPALALASAWAFWSGQPAALSAGLGVAAAIVAAAILTARWLKLSLHVGFAVLVSSLFWPEMFLVGIGLGFTCLIGWSRLYLARHDLADLLAGAVAGGLGGLVFQLLLVAP
jgi:hypothetical protein